MEAPEIRATLTGAVGIRGGVSGTAEIRGKVLPGEPEIRATLTGAGGIDGSINETDQIRGTVTLPNSLQPTIYDGPYTVTPGETAQVLETSGLVMSENVTVEKIPSNWGKITWDGYVLTVS